MNKGVLQREQALKIKRIVSQTKSKKQQQRLRHVTQSPQHLIPELDPLQTWKVSSSTLFCSAPTHGNAVARDGSAGLHDNFQIQTCEGDLSTFDKLMWSASSYNTFLPAEIFDQDDGMPAYDPLISDAATDVENADMESNFVLSGSSRRVSASTSILPSARETDSGWNSRVSSTDVQLEANGESAVTLCEQTWSTSYHDSHLSRNPIFKNQNGLPCFIQINHSSASGTLGHHASRPVGSSSSIICGNTEDTLFMHYLDQVFYIQYPFYSNRRGRGWLFSILRRAKSAYHAALALSQYHQHLTLPQDNSIASSLDYLRGKDGHYDLALREMQISIAKSHMWSGTSGLIRSVEALTCTLQLLFWEVRFPTLFFHLQH